MQIQITLYDCQRKVQLTRHVVDVPREEWESMDFLEQQAYCKHEVEKDFHWHWRELEEDET